MKSKPPTVESTTHIWPNGETPCIWMQAGLVEYKLCDRNLACDECPFDALMSGGQTSNMSKERHLKKIKVEQRHSLKPSSETMDIWLRYRQIFFDPEAYYGKGFWYLKPIEGQIARVGLDDLAVLFLPVVKEIVLPQIETKFAAEQTCAYLLTVAGTIPLSIPLAGRVICVNDQIIEALNKSHSRQRGNLWLFEYQVEDLSHQLTSMRWGDQTIDYLLNRWQTIVDHLEKALYRHHPHLGKTSQDGGEPLRSIEQMLGEKEYFRIISTFFKEG